MSNATDDAAHRTLDCRRELQHAGLTASRALLAPDATVPEAALSIALGALAEALEVEMVALVRLELDGRPASTGRLVAEVVWAHAIGGARLVDHPVPLAVLPDLVELTDNQQVVRVRVDQLPDDVAARVEQTGVAGTDIIAVPLIAADEVLGALAVVAPFEREWTGAEMRFVESVAGVVWTFLRHHHTDDLVAQKLIDAELLAGLGRMVVDTGSRVDPTVVTSILARLGAHVGVDGLIAFERRGDRGLPVGHWSAGPMAEPEPTTPTIEEWTAMRAGRPLAWRGGTWTVFPAVHEGAVAGFLAVVDPTGIAPRHHGVIESTVDVLRQLRVRVLTEWYLHRQRDLDHLRSRIATAYVEADHWEVVETTGQALESIGEIIGADRVVWLECAEGGVASERVWSRGEDPPRPFVDPAEVRRLAESDGPYVVEWENEPARGPDGAASRMPNQIVVVPAVERGRVLGGLAVSVPAETRISSADKSVLSEIASLIQQMEQWAAVEAESEVRRQRLHFQATHDDLTGLGNRRLLLETLANVISGGPVAVLMIDMDRFKVINDSLGHTAGDAVLVAVADRLRLSVREPDLTCRFGGDEFAVMVGGTDEQVELAALAQRLIEVVREPVNVRGTTMIPTCSIGIAVSGPDDDLESVLRHADAALYAAKSRGKDRYAFFDDDHRESLRGRLELETTMRQGLRSHQFEPWFQPEIDLVTRDVIGVEALIRWNHPTDGILPASAFIDVAEDVGLASEMSLIALEGSCRAHRTWREVGFNTRIRVNVAAAQLQTGDLDVIIGAVLGRYDVAPNRLCIEITERSLMVDPESSASALRRLRHLGIEVAIDDFGTGFSSLARLRGLPVDTLKIDRSFVGGIVTSRTDRDIVRTVVGLARAVGLDVVAEGVEQEAQAEILTDMGCRRAQGWLWAGALPAEEIPTLSATVR